MAILINTINEPVICIVLPDMAGMIRLIVLVGTATEDKAVTVFSLKVIDFGLKSRGH